MMIRTLAMMLLPIAAHAAEPLRVAVPSAIAAPETTAARLFTDDGFDRPVARELAKALGRRVEWVGTGGDLVLGYDHDGIAVQPRMLSVAMRRDTDIGTWGDLRGRTLCVTETNAQGVALAAKLGAVVMPQPAPALSLMRVRTGECDAALHDADALAALFADPDWAKFSATLPPRRVTPLGIRAAPALRDRVIAALAVVAAPDARAARNAAWARDVALEVWLEQDAPDCH